LEFLGEREKALRESETFSRSIIDASPVPLAISDTHENVIFLNNAFIQTLGYTKDDIPTQVEWWIRAFPDVKYRELIAARWKKSIKDAAHTSGPTLAIEANIRCKDNSYRTFVVNAVAMDKDFVNRYLVIFYDITDRKLAEAILAESARRKDDFLAALGHELRNPLAPIRNAAQILKLIGLSDPNAEKAREMIERQTVHLSHIVDDLLDVSRISHGKIGLHSVPLDWVQLVRENAEDFRSMIESAGITLTLDLPSDSQSLWVQGDRTRLAQVLSNLLVNAQKFTESGGMITVTLATNPLTRHVELSVRDTGMGISQDVINYLFEPFVQAEMDLARRRGGLGLGLGLALSKGLIELHGGTIHAASKGPKQGALFTVCLPLLAERPVAIPVEASVVSVLKHSQERPEAALSKTHTSSSEPSGRSPILSKRVLIIEDNFDAAESMQMLLKFFGYTAEVALDGASGLKIANSFAPDIILCDIGLPGEINGYEVARAIRKESALGSVYLIAVSGYGQDEDKRKAREAGFDDHINKPVDPVLLKQKLLEVSGMKK
jgi:PAS domain S-box-containing protein